MATDRSGFANAVLVSRVPGGGKRHGDPPRSVTLEHGVRLSSKGLHCDVRLLDGKIVQTDEKDLIYWQGYPSHVSSATPSNDGDLATSITIWRCEMYGEGLFSAVFWALGFLEAALDNPAVLLGSSEHVDHILIDWTDEKLPYHGGAAGPLNAWDAFFKQPPPLAAILADESEATAGPEARAQAVSAAAIKRAAAAGSLHVTTTWTCYKKLGNFRGSEPAGWRIDQAMDEDAVDDCVQASRQPAGGLDAATISAGATAFRRWLVVQPEVQNRVESFMAAMRQDHQLDAGEWLAVHVRQTDRLRLANSAAWKLSLPSLTTQALDRAAQTRCRGIFVASDDKALKAGLVAEIRQAGLASVSFDSLLSSTPGTAAHQDPSLDRCRNARDCLVEVLVMAKCRALVSTFSNVSVAAVFFAHAEAGAGASHSPEGREAFRHFLFDVDATLEPEEPCMF